MSAHPVSPQEDGAATIVASWLAGLSPALGFYPGARVFNAVRQIFESHQRLTAENAALRERAECAERRVIEVMESTRKPHRIVDEDCWFSCPKALDEYGENACCNEAEVANGRCNCGADAFNAKLDAQLAALRSPSAAPTPETTK